MSSSGPLIAQGQASGELDRRFSVDDLAMGIYGQLNSYVMVRLLVPDCPLDRRTARQIVRLFLEGAARRHPGPTARRAPPRQPVTPFPVHDTQNSHSLFSLSSLVLGGLAGVKALQFKKLMAYGGKSFAQPPESVSSAVVRRRNGKAPSPPSAPSWPCRA